MKLVIFTDNAVPIGAMRGIGAYRLKTAAVAAGYQAIVIDMLSELLDTNVGNELIEKFIDKDTIVAFSTTWFQTPPDMSESLSGSIIVSSRNKIPCKDQKKWFQFLQSIKLKGSTVVFGGSNIFYFFNELHKGLIDFFIVGYGDRDIVDLLNYKSKKTLSLKYNLKEGFALIDNNNNFLINDIATRFTADDYLNIQEILPIEISRGCRFKCKFCYYPLNGRKKNDYIRDGEDLYQEFMYNYENFGTTKYRFLDDTYNESIEKLQTVNDVIQRLPFNLKFESYIRHELLTTEQLKLLKSSGLSSAILGIETLNKKSGEPIGKGMSAERTMEIVQQLRETLPNCYISSGMIIGLPDDNEQNLNWAYNLTKRSDLFDKINWYSLVIRSKSKLFTLSDLEENYKDYGYTVNENNSKYYQTWTNRHGFTSEQANKIVLDLENKSIENGTFSTGARYALSIENIGIKKFAKNFAELDKRILYNTLRYKKIYIKKLLGSNLKDSYDH